MNGFLLGKQLQLAVATTPGTVILGPTDLNGRGPVRLFVENIGSVALDSVLVEVCPDYDEFASPPSTWVELSVPGDPFSGLASGDVAQGVIDAPIPVLRVTAIADGSPTRVNVWAVLGAYA